MKTILIARNGSVQVLDENVLNGTENEPWVQINGRSYYYMDYYRSQEHTSKDVCVMVETVENILSYKHS